MDPVIVKLSKVEPRHAVAGYEFLLDAIEEGCHVYRSEHINPDQVVCSVANFAVDQFGLLAPIVLNRWRIMSTADVADMTMRLIEAEVLIGRSGESRESFQYGLWGCLLSCLKSHLDEEMLEHYRGQL